MRRSLPLLMLLSVPAQAHAAPLAETPITRLDDALALCTQSAGLGGVITSGAGKFGAGGSARFFTPTPQGFKAGEKLKLTKSLGGCPAAATRADGAAIVATPAAPAPGRFALAYAVRPPGGAWGAPQTIPVTGQGTVQRVAVAINDAGQPLLLWLEAHVAGQSLTYTVRAQINGVVQTLADTGASVAPDLRAGIAGSGEAVVLWDSLRNRRELVQAAGAPPGGAFGPAQTVGEASALATPALAVADDGHALAVVPQLDSLDVAERAPGGQFGPLTSIAPAADRTAIASAAALDAGGAAAVAWVGYGDGQAGVITRPAGGTFGLSRILQAATKPAGDPFYDSEAYFLPSAEAGELAIRGNPSVALTPGGPQVTWKRDDQVRVASGTTIQTFGGGLRTPSALAQIPVAGGEPAVAWLEESRGSGIDDLHLAIAGGTTPARPTPRLTVGAPVRRKLAPGESLTLHVRCSAACALRATTATGGDGTLTLGHAGRGQVDISSQTRTLAPTRTRRVRVTFRYGAPGTAHPRTKTVAVRLTGVPLPPTPRIRQLTATRDGGDVTVRWRVDHPTAYAGYFVSGGATATSAPLASADGGRVTRTRRTFSARLRGAAGVKVVVVHLRDDATGRTRRATTGVVP
jgi:hypothetical protein